MAQKIQQFLHHGLIWHWLQTGHVHDRKAIPLAFILTK
jgi:hypothetical protein